MLYFRSQPGSVSAGSVSAGSLQTALIALSADTLLVKYRGENLPLSLSSLYDSDFKNKIHLSR